MIWPSVEKTLDETSDYESENDEIGNKTSSESKYETNNAMDKNTSEQKKSSYSR